LKEVAFLVGTTYNLFYDAIMESARKIALLGLSRDDISAYKDKPAPHGNPEHTPLSVLEPDNRGKK